MRFILALIFGAIASFGFAPNSLWPAPILSLFLIFNTLKKQKFKYRLISVYLFGLGLLLPNQFWTGTYVGDIPWIALSLMQAFLFLPLAVVSQKGGKYNPFLFGFGLVVSEFLLRTIPFTGFGWSRLSFTQVDGPFAIFYPYIGAVGLAFLLAFLAANRDFKSILFILLLITGLNIWQNHPIADKQLKIALVQGGVKNLGLDFNSTPKEVFQRHLQTTLTKIKVGEVDLIIWPENAVDVDVFRNRDVQQLITDTSAKLQTPILIGGITRVNGQLENVSVLFDSNISATYVKRYLTPFGEYIPLRSILQEITPLTNEVVDFSPGTNDNQMVFGSFTGDIFICYEILNDQFKNQISSDFIIVQTNNATFGDTSQLDQELQIARVRALESGREVAYVSTTGITSFIGRDGKIKSDLAKFESAVLIDKISTYSDIQVNQKLGFFPEIFACFMIFFILLTIRRLN